MPLTDVSDLSQSPQGSVDGITVANFFATVPSPVNVLGAAGATVIAATNAHIHVVGANTAGSNITVDAFVGSPTLNLRRAQGTSAVPTIITTGVTVGQINILGFDSGSTFYETANINIAATENWASGAARGVSFIINTTLTGASSRTPRLSLDGAGLATFSHGASFASTVQVTKTSGTLLKLSYDASNDLDLTVSSAGVVGYDAAGASASHVFAQPVTVTGLLTGTAGLTIAGAIAGATTYTGAGLIQTTVTTEQLRLRYDASNYWTVTVDSAGSTTLATEGTAADMIYNVDTSRVHIWRVANSFAASLSSTSFTAKQITSQTGMLVDAGGITVTLGGATVTGDSTITGTLTVTTAFGCNSKAAQTAYVSGGALNAYGAGANGLDTGANMSALHALVVSIRAALVANGIMS